MSEQKENELNGLKGKESTAINVNKNRWYTDADINNYVETVIRFSKEDNIDGYRDKHLYLLNNDFPSGSEEDPARYLVAVTNAVDCIGKALPIDHFLDKEKQTRSSPSICLEKLLAHIEELASLKANENQLQKEIEKILAHEKQRFDTDFIQYLHNKLKEVDFNGPALQGKIKELDRIDRIDVFDEILPAMQEQDPAHVKILFPYNITQTHWLTGEIIIHKNGNDYDIEIYAHDPYGKEHRAKMDEKQFKQIAETIKAKIEAPVLQGGAGGHVNSCKNMASSYDRRQLLGDGVSCGVITASDLVKRIKGQTLSIAKPYSYGAVELREKHVKDMQKYLLADDATRENFISRNQKIDLGYLEEDSTENLTLTEIERWYTDEDISDYVGTAIRFSKEDNIGGYRDKRLYLLNNDFPSGSEEDPTRYLVAVTNAVDCAGKALPIDHFLDKEKQTRSSPSICLEKLLAHIGELASLKANENQLQKEIEKILAHEKQRSDTDFIQYLHNKLKEVDFNGPALQEKIKELDRIDRIDVFDEILPAMQEQDPAHVKILFPYNITQTHWLTGEIIIHKNGNDYDIEIYAHDPYGKEHRAKMDEKQFKQIAETIKARIEAPVLQGGAGGHVNSCENMASPYDRRQLSNDGVSCGVITASDLVKRVKGQTLNITKPYSYGAVELRKSHIEIIKTCLSEDDATKMNFLSRNQSSLDTFVSYMHKKSESQINIKSWYKEIDIENYLEVILQTPDFGGYQSGGHGYLLNGNDKDKKFNDIDNNRYLVAVIPPIDAQQKFLPLEYFFDKNAAENPLLDLLKLLTIDLQKMQHLDDAKLFKEISKFLKDKKPDESLIQKAASVLKESNFDLRSVFKYIKDHENRADVFDEVLEALKEDGNEHAKILFPFKLDESASWTTGEIKFHKQGNELVVDVYAHDPYGGGQMDKEIMQAIEAALNKKISEYGFSSIKINSKKSEFSDPRQDSKDAVSGGVIVIEDIMKRAKGETLAQPEPYQNKALALREKHIENIERYLLPENPVRQGFINRNKTTLQVAANSAKENILMAERKRKSLIYDLKNLITILETIEQFNENYSGEMLDINSIEFTDLKDILSRIGADARRINYNDKDANCIRNKYGYEDRAHSGQIRETGIPWENLALLSDICNPKIYPGIKKEEYLALVNAGLLEIALELKSLQNAIIHIINNEQNQLSSIREILEKDTTKNSALLKSLSELEEKLKTVPGTNTAFNGKTANIIQLTNYFKDERGLFKLTDSCSNTHEQIFQSDMHSLRNRYKLARVLLVLGESVNTLTDEAKSLAPQIPFKKMITVRNKLTHFLHGKYKHLDTNPPAFEALCSFSKDEIPKLHDALLQLLQLHREKKQFNESEFSPEETWAKLKTEVVIEEVIEDAHDSRNSAKIAHEFSLKYIRPAVAKALYGEHFDEKAFNVSGADPQVIKEKGQRIGRETARIKNALLLERESQDEYSIEIIKGNEVINLTLHFDSDAVNELDLYHKKSTFEEKIKNIKDELEKLKKKDSVLKEEKKQLTSLKKLFNSDNNGEKTVKALIDELRIKISGLSGKKDQASKNQVDNLNKVIEFLEKQDEVLKVQEVSENISNRINELDELIKAINQRQGSLGKLTSKKTSATTNAVEDIAPNLTVFLSEIEKKTDKSPAPSEKLTEFDHAQRLLDNMLKEMNFLGEMVEQIKIEEQSNNYPEIEYSIGVIGQQIRDLMDKNSAFMSFSLLAIDMQLDKLLNDLQKIIDIRNQGLLHDLYAVDHSDILSVAEKSVLSVKDDLAAVSKRYEQNCKLDKSLPEYRDKVYSSKNQKSKFTKIYAKSLDDTVVEYRTPKDSKTENNSATEKTQDVQEKSTTTIIRPRSFSK